MNRKDYLDKLRFLLSDLPKEETDDIIYDYEEHFSAAMENGKTEDEIVTGLGDVRMIAKQYRAAARVEKASSNWTIPNIFNAVLSTIALGFFNLVIVLGPFAAVFGIIIGFFGASIGISVGGLALMAASFGVSYLPFDIPMSVSFPVTFFTGLGIGCLGILLFIAGLYISKFFYMFTLKYLKWNIEVIKGSKGGERA